MSQHYKQIQHGQGEAARALRERLAREEMGDAAYEKSVSYADDRSFRMFGIVFIVLFAVVVLAAMFLGY